MSSLAQTSSRLQRPATVTIEKAEAAETFERFGSELSRLNNRDLWDRVNHAVWAAVLDWQQAQKAAAIEAIRTVQVPVLPDGIEDELEF